jgi:hypothetical protein
MKDPDYTNLITHKESDAFIRWTCPEGHKQKDYTPVDSVAYCIECRRDYRWSEITKYSGLMTAEWLL